MPDQVSREAKKRHVAVNMIFPSSFLLCLSHDSNAVVDGEHSQRLAGWLQEKKETCLYYQ